MTVVTFVKFTASHGVRYSSARTFFCCTTCGYEYKRKASTVWRANS